MNWKQAGILTLSAMAVALAILQDGRVVGQNVPAARAGATASQVTFAKPDRIRYDDKSLIIEGKPVFIYSGAFHYFRCPRELWKDRFTRMKEAGMNCVETYLAWNYHEPLEPASPSDFSKLQHMDELNDWIQMARDMGFHVIIRPGPYICAEWDRGGLPEWLIKYKPADFRTTGGGFLRSAHPAKVQWDKHWMEAAAKVVKPHLITNVPAGQPGVIGWQLENELNLCDIAPDEQAAFLRALGECSIAAGIDVPMFACRTKAANADAWLQAHLYDSITCYPRYDMSILLDRIRNIAEPQPGKFQSVMELQAGWFSEIGGKLSEEMGFSDAQLNQIGMICIERGITLINWYMFYGGSQFGYGASQNMTQSYDYDSPIRESGGVGPRYFAAKALGLMLQEHGTRLIRSELMPLKVTSVQLEGTTSGPGGTGGASDVFVALRQASDGSQYFFVRTESRTEARKGAAAFTVNGKSGTVRFDLPPFGARIFYIPPSGDSSEGQWLPKAVNPPARPDRVPGEEGIKVTLAGMAPEVMENWKPVKAGQSFASMGIPDSRYVTFRSAFTLSEAQAANPPVLLGRCAGATLVYAINGQLVPPEAALGGIVQLAGRVKPGENRVDVLVENTGNHNHGGADVYKSAPELRLAPAAGVKPLEWRMKPIGAVIGLLGTRLEVAPDINVLDFPVYPTDKGPNIFAENTTGVFQTEINVTAQQIAAGVLLMIGKLDETGEVLVNGQRVGGNLTERLQPLARDITTQLKPGKNSIVAVIANKDHQGGLYGGTFIAPRGEALPSLEMSMDTRGTREKYGAGSGTWSTTAQSTSLLNWHRMDFAMPAQTAGTWVPYRLHLEAELNGQVYLNGHHLGTYWAAGPQRDIWLPECWLNFGPDSKNVVAIQGRPTATGQTIKVAEVRPLKEFAERR